MKEELLGSNKDLIERYGFKNKTMTLKETHKTEPDQFD